QDRFVLVGIEFGSEGFDRFQTTLLEQRGELTLDQKDSSHPCQLLQISGKAGDCSFQVVEDREQIVDKPRLGALQEVNPLLLGAPPVVREVRLCALPAAKLLFLLGLERLELLLERSLCGLRA